MRSKRTKITENKFVVTDDTRFHVFDASGHMADGLFTLAQVARDFGYDENHIRRTIKRNGHATLMDDVGQVIVRPAP